MMSTLSSAAAAIQGSLHGEDCEFQGVSTDSRTLQAGQLFVALSGPNFDGSKFVSHARGKGAAGALVNSVVKDDIAQITVDDTRLALGRLGSAWRHQQAATVVGITGSNGKTTLKELTAACLATKAPTLATEGNLNNDIGMPLMMLRIDESHGFAVLEMGANHAGEIAYLTSLAKPSVVVITNAAAAHLEGFGSLDGVAHAKAEILQDETRPDVAVLNADDEYFDYWMSLVDGVDVLSFGLGENADIRADEIETGRGQTHFTLHLLDMTIDLTLPLAGVHNVRNACAAAAVAVALDVSAADIKAALESADPVGGRLNPLQGKNGATLYDDSYNANPLSVVAAAEFLSSLPGESRFVLGDMFELGDEAARMHSEVGESIASAGVDRLYTFGELSAGAAAAFGEGATTFEAIEPLIEAVSIDLSASVNVLVKGSRGMRMERIVEALRLPAPLSKEA